MKKDIDGIDWKINYPDYTDYTKILDGEDLEKKERDAFEKVKMATQTHMRGNTKENTNKRISCTVKRTRRNDNINKSAK